MKRVLVILMTLCMVIAASGIGVFADDEDMKVENSWQTVTKLPEERHYFAVTAVDDKIYTIGGVNNNFSSNLKEYNITTDTWTEKTAPPVFRYYMQAVAVNGKIYTIGGFDGGSEHNNVTIYDPKTDTWTSGTPVPQTAAISRYAMSAIEEKIYIFNGKDIYI